MLDNLKIKADSINNLEKLNIDEKTFRINNLESFNQTGFPSKHFEDWKFSDLHEILTKNFNKLNFQEIRTNAEKVEYIQDFEHNKILIINGKLKSSDFTFEEKSKIIIEPFINKDFKNRIESNPLVYLNHALSDKGFYLKVENNYKFKKILVIYRLYTDELDESVINSRNNIILGNNSELHILEVFINNSKKNFLNNDYESIYLGVSSKFKNISMQEKRSRGYFHKFSKNILDSRSNYSSYLFPSGLKFNKLDIELDLKGENIDCNIHAASFLDKQDHQEIKTRINHFYPNCKSYQKVKNVLSDDSKGVYQGKIYVNKIAQKTDAYQLSNAVMLGENSEFDSKPELEIYADDVKCSHGSTSGNVDEDSVYYLMTRGLTRQESIKLLVSGFLKEILESIKNQKIKDFLQRKMEFFLYENRKH